MGKPRRGPWVSNRVSAKEARRLAEAGQLSWSQWEKRVDMILRTNGWEWWSDRVIPRSAVSNLGLAKPQVDRLMRVLQSVGRKRGLTDRLIRKVFAGGYEEIPPPLRQRLGLLPLYRGEVGVVGVVEMKTGGAETTDEQDAWLEIAELCPGMFGYVAHPSRQDELVAILGGKYPIL